MFVQRLSGKPALSLAPIAVPPAGPVRSFFAYWIAMLALDVFMFCCVLALQGISALLLPRRWSLRASAFLQLAVFCLLVSGYFLQRSPVTVLVTGVRSIAGCRGFLHIGSWDYTSRSATRCIPLWRRSPSARGSVR